MEESDEIIESPANEFIADICINEEVGVWKSVVLSQSTTIQSVFRKLKLKLNGVAPWERMWLRPATLLENSEVVNIGSYC